LEIVFQFLLFSQFQNFIWLQVWYFSLQLIFMEFLLSISWFSIHFLSFFIFFLLLFFLFCSSFCDFFFLSINSPTGSIQVSLNGKVVLRTDNSIISLNTLYLVALIKNGNVMRIFRNGEPVATITNSPLINIKNNKMYLGYNFIGIMDEVSIYSSPLSKVEIQNQANQLSLRILFSFFVLFIYSIFFSKKLFIF